MKKLIIILSLIIGVSIAFGANSFVKNLSWNSITNTFDAILPDGSTKKVMSATGVTNGTSACTGCVGEVISSVSSWENTPASTVWGDVTSISLTAGTWVIFGEIRYYANGCTGTTEQAGISTSSGTGFADLVEGDNNALSYFGLSGQAQFSLSLHGIVKNITSTTPIYLKAHAAFSAGQPQVRGRLRAIRIR